MTHHQTQRANSGISAVGYSTGWTSQGVVGIIRDDNFHLSPKKLIIMQLQKAVLEIAGR